MTPQEQPETNDRGDYFSYVKSVEGETQQLTKRTYRPRTQHIGPDATLPSVTEVLGKLVLDDSNIFFSNPGCFRGEVRGYGENDILTILRRPNVLVREENHYSPAEDNSKARIIDFRKYTVFGTTEEIEKFDALVQAKDRELSSRDTAIK